MASAASARRKLMDMRKIRRAGFQVWQQESCINEAIVLMHGPRESKICVVKECRQKPATHIVIEFVSRTKYCERKTSRKVSEVIVFSSAPYENGVFLLKVSLPSEYPFKSPSIGFLTRCLHVNVDLRSGSICLDVINQRWTPLQDLSSVFQLLIPQLLTYGNAADPLNPEAAGLQRADPKRFVLEVREMVRYHATPAKAVQTLKSMGFEASIDYIQMPDTKKEQTKKKGGAGAAGASSGTTSGPGAGARGPSSSAASTAPMAAPAEAERARGGSIVSSSASSSRPSSASSSSHGDGGETLSRASPGSDGGRLSIGGSPASSSVPGPSSGAGGAGGSALVPSMPMEGGAGVAGTVGAGETDGIEEGGAGVFGVTGSSAGRPGTKGVAGAVSGSVAMEGEGGDFGELSSDDDELADQDLEYDEEGMSQVSEMSNL